MPPASSDLNGQYQVTIYNDQKNEVLTVSDNFVVIADLEPSTDYKLSVDAMTNDGQPVERQTPGRFRVAALNSSAISARWSMLPDSSDLNGQYQVTIYNDEKNEVLTVSDNFVVIADLEPSTDYKLSVDAMTNDGQPVGKPAYGRITTESSGNFLAKCVTSFRL
ncbi:unnamed protein product [Schistocephalus solidus]|uniref:Fibronectin type-III domain-containing protein n=1 Tax=Schistocephalus solidus TaxID=70667 RepID=A0A183TQE4_SCHSO|nr:unnamed protein product [Schistocephalus solidus]